MTGITQFRWNRPALGFARLCPCGFGHALGWFWAAPHPL